MNETDKPLSERESLELITSMINKAKDAYHDTGIGAIMWGAVIAFCSLEKLAEIHFRFALPFDVYLLTVIAIVPQIFISIKEKKERKVKSFDDIYLDTIWMTFGICIFLLIVIINRIGHDWRPLVADYERITGQHTRFWFYEYISSLFLLLYGIPTFITGVACRFRPMIWGGVICWVCSIVSLFTEVRIDLLLTAASAIMAWLIPGIMMEKEYRVSKKSQASVHVQRP